MQKNILKKSYQFFLNKQFPEAIHLCKQALRINPKFRNPYLRLGNMFSILRRYDEADDYYNRFLKYSLDAENQLDISRGYNAIGYLLCQKKKIKEAIKYFYLTLDIVKTLNRTKEIARCYNNIALANRIGGIYDKAHYFYQKALRISKKENHLDRLSYYNFNMAIMFKEQKKYFKAICYMRKYKKLDKILKKKGIKLAPSEESFSSLE